MSENHTEKEKKLRFFQNLALTGYFSLLVILTINITWLIPSRHFPTALVLIVIVTPLLFPLRGLLHGNPYTYQWSSFLSLAYFAHGITEVTAYPEHWYAGVLEVAAALMMYSGCVLYARVFKQEAKKLQAHKLREQEQEQEQEQEKG